MYWSQFTGFGLIAETLVSTERYTGTIFFSCFDNFSTYSFVLGRDKPLKLPVL